MNTTELKLVIDTNILISIIGKISAHRWIFDAIISERISLCITNEILLEYREILERKTTVTIAENVIELILLLPTTIQKVTHFNFQLIDLDKEDNKFIDCAVASNAHFLVSNDNHFNILKTIEFPVVSLLTLQEFEDLYKSALTK